jgi:fumarylpyruvate hydrolase
MTRRDLQGVCKKMGRPWEIGKAFERSAPMGKITPISEVGNMEKGILNYLLMVKHDKMVIWI